jgi:hypothetical protein
MEYLLDEQDFKKYQHEIIPVPWLGFDHDSTTQYDVAPDLESYAARRGWDESRLAPLRDSERLLEASREELAVLQSMLFFGIWEGALRKRLKSADFIVSTSDGPILRTTALRQALLEFSQATSRRKLVEITESLRSECLSFRAIQNQTLRWADSLFITTRRHRDWDKSPVNTIVGLVRVVFLSSNMLADLRICFPRPVRMLILPTASDMSAWHRDRYVRLARDKGWCPSVLRRIGQDVPELTEYAPLLENRPTHLGQSHSMCSKSVCRFSNVDTQDFKARHIDESCGCQLLRLPMERIEEVLGRGGYFVVDADQLMNKSASSLVPFDPGRPYIAISHVWSHGLGGNADDGLPTCQVESIVRLIRGMLNDSKVAPCFWIDTLCIPRKHGLKMQSIRLMEQIYRNAAKVLVLDRDIMKVDFTAISYERLLLEIACSDWNSRLWTLQEAFLAKKVSIAFQHQVVDASTVRLLYINAPMTCLLITLQRQIGWLVGNVRTFGEVVRELGGRQSSEPSDEPLVLATLMGLDNATVTLFKGEERFRELWSLLGKVSRDIVFWGNSDRLSRNGYRWAPKSFMGPNGGYSIAIMTESHAIVGSTGLRGTYMVLALGDSVHINKGETNINLQFRDGVALNLRIESGRRSWDQLWFDTLLLESNLGPETSYCFAAGLQSEGGSSDGAMAYRFPGQVSKLAARKLRVARTIEIPADCVISERSVLVT